MEGGHQSCQNVHSMNIWLVGVTPPVSALFITKHKFKLYIKHIDPAPFTPIWEYLGSDLNSNSTRIIKQISNSILMVVFDV